MNDHEPVGQNNLDEISEDINIEIPEDFSISKFVPLNREFLRDFERSTKQSEALGGAIQTEINGIMENTEHYLELVLDRNSASNFEVDMNFIATNLVSLERLIRAQFDAKIWVDSIDESKNKIRQKQRELTETSLQSLGEHTNEQQKSIIDYIEEDYDNSKEIHLQSNTIATLLKNDERYEYMKNISFILEHPEDPLPDEQEDEDLAISGGKISLKDPISMNYFKDPLICNKCYHVYERVTITEYLKGNSNCPVDGCNAIISENDLKIDKIMKLRVNAFLTAKSRDHKSLNRNHERL